jgi:hypothetical protein
MAGGNPDGKSEPFRKSTVTELEMQIRMECKCGGGQRLSAVNTSWRTPALGHVKGLAMVKLTTTKKPEGVIGVMEKLRHRNQFQYA